MQKLHIRCSPLWEETSTVGPSPMWACRQVETWTCTKQCHYTSPCLSGPQWWRQQAISTSVGMMMTMITVEGQRSTGLEGGARISFHCYCDVQVVRGGSRCLGCLQSQSHRVLMLFCSCWPWFVKTGWSRWWSHPSTGWSAHGPVNTSKKSWHSFHNKVDIMHSQIPATLLCAQFYCQCMLTF